MRRARNTPVSASAFAMAALTKTACAALNLNSEVTAPAILTHQEIKAADHGNSLMSSGRSMPIASQYSSMRERKGSSDSDISWKDSNSALAILTNERANGLGSAMAESLSLELKKKSKRAEMPPLIAHIACRYNLTLGALGREVMTSLENGGAPDIGPQHRHRKGGRHHESARWNSNLRSDEVGDPAGMAE